jgi:phosphate transport system substrate-binding protein
MQCFQRPVVVCIYIAILLFAVFGCENKGRDAVESNPGSDTAELQGTIRVSGAWALYPMMVKWGEEYGKIHPKMRIDVSAGGAGKGAADALAGLVDIGMVSREIKPEEIKQGAFHVPVVKDAVFPTINDKNPALTKGLMGKGIRKKTIEDLWMQGRALTWGAVIGVPSNKDRIQVYTRSDSCGAAETWAKYLGGTQEKLKGVGVYGDPGVAEAIKKDKLGVGYNNLNYAYDAKTGFPLKGIQVVPIDVNENGKIDPDEDLSTKQKAISAVVSGKYPSPPARDLYLMTKGKFKGTAREFVKWILKDGQKYIGEGGYISLSQSQIKEALERIED